jgi:3-methylcrotonyl-CoA carboxylase alpha subunit
MIAKLVSSGATRDEAIERLVDTLEQVEVWPVRTNAAFLVRAASDPDFRAGRCRHLLHSGPDRLAAAAVGAVGRDSGRWRPSDARGGLSAPAPGPTIRGRRSRASAPMPIRPSRWRFATASETRSVAVEEGQALEGVATASGDSILVFADGQAYAFALPGSAAGAAGGGGGDGAILSPMPGRLISVDVRQGDKVTKGQKLLTSRGDEDGA